MSEFGDFDPDDALDIEAADPEQVARKLHRLRVIHGLEVGGFDDLTPSQRFVLIAIITDLLAWLRRQGAR